MKKILDLIVNMLIILYEIFLYSLIFPMSIGVLSILYTPAGNWLMNKLGIFMYVIGVLIGIGIKFSRDRNDE